MTKLVVLGSAATFPRADRNTSGYAVITDSGETYLFDCGEGTAARLQELAKELNEPALNPARIKGVFLTHAHADHVLGLPGLVHTMEALGIEKDKLKVFCPEGTDETIRHLLHYSLITTSDDARASDADMVITMVHPVKTSPDAPVFTGKGFQIQAFVTDHAMEGSIGFVFKQDDVKKVDNDAIKAFLGATDDREFGKLMGTIKKDGKVTLGDGRVITREQLEAHQTEHAKVFMGAKIVYTGDCKPSEDVTIMKGVDVLAHDATYVTADAALAAEMYHSTIPQAVDVAVRAQAKNLLLTHISNRYDHTSGLQTVSDEAKTAIAGSANPALNFAVAQDGMMIKINIHAQTENQRVEVVLPKAKTGPARMTA